MEEVLSALLVCDFTFQDSTTTNQKCLRKRIPENYERQNLNFAGTGHYVKFTSML
jgi:hypothetical protein